MRNYATCWELQKATQTVDVAPVKSPDFLPRASKFAMLPESSARNGLFRIGIHARYSSPCLLLQHPKLSPLVNDPIQTLVESLQNTHTRSGFCRPSSSAAWKTSLSLPALLSTGLQSLPGTVLSAATVTKAFWPPEKMPLPSPEAFPCLRPTPNATSFARSSAAL